MCGLPGATYNRVSHFVSKRLRLGIRLETSCKKLELSYCSIQVLLLLLRYILMSSPFKFQQNKEEKAQPNKQQIEPDPTGNDPNQAPRICSLIRLSQRTTENQPIFFCFSGMLTSLLFFFLKNDGLKGAPKPQKRIVSRHLCGTHWHCPLGYRAYSDYSPVCVFCGVFF